MWIRSQLKETCAVKWMDERNSTLLLCSRESSCTGISLRKQPLSQKSIIKRQYLFSFRIFHLSTRMLQNTSGLSCTHFLQKCPSFMLCQVLVLTLCLTQAWAGNIKTSNSVFLASVVNPLEWTLLPSICTAIIYFPISKQKTVFVSFCYFNRLMKQARIRLLIVLHRSPPFQ